MHFDLAFQQIRHPESGLEASRFFKRCGWYSKEENRCSGHSETNATCHFNLSDKIVPARRNEIQKQMLTSVWNWSWLGFRQKSFFLGVIKLSAVMPTCPFEINKPFVKKVIVSRSAPNYSDRSQWHEFLPIVYQKMNDNPPRRTAQLGTYKGVEIKTQRFWQLKTS